MAVYIHEIVLFSFTEKNERNLLKSETKQVFTVLSRIEDTFKGWKTSKRLENCLIKWWKKDEGRNSSTLTISPTVSLGFDKQNSRG